MGRKSHRTRNAVGPNHRPDAQPLHRGQSVDRALSLRGLLAMAASSTPRLSRRGRTQLAILASVTIISIAVMAFGFVKVPALLGIGRYTVKVDLPASGGLYPTSVVNYRGSEIGSVKSVDVTQNGVVAVLSLKSGIAIPSNVT